VDVVDADAFLSSPILRYIRAPSSALRTDTECSMSPLPPNLQSVVRSRLRRSPDQGPRDRGRGKEQASPQASPLAKDLFHTELAARVSSTLVTSVSSVHPALNRTKQVLNFMSPGVHADGGTRRVQIGQAAAGGPKIGHAAPAGPQPYKGNDGLDPPSHLEAVEELIDYLGGPRWYRRVDISPQDVADGRKCKFASRKALVLAQAIPCPDQPNSLLFL